jgi:hypothetical protein
VQDVLNRLYSVKQLRQTLHQEVVISGQKAGDMVSSMNPWESKINGYITSMESNLTQSGHTASIEILGEEIKDS